MRYRRAVRFAALVCALAATSCEKPVVSLEEAKQITTAIQGESFVPPPRTIADVTAILDQQKPDPARAEANRKAADAAPPPGASGDALAQFYFDRATAAQQLGRAEQQVRDLHEAERIGRESGADIDRIMQSLVIANSQVGNANAALVAVKAWQDAVPDNIWGEKLGSKAVLVNVYARLGNIPAAEQALVDTESFFKTYKSHKTWPIFYEDWYALLLTARANLETERGHLGAAEATWREAIRNRQISLQKYEQEQAATPSAFPRQTLETGETTAMLSLANVLRLEGKLLEAEVSARRALLLLLERRTRYSVETAGAMVGLAYILNDQGRYAEAEKLGSVAVTTYEGLGAGAGSWPLARARSLVGEAQAAQGRWPDALATFRKMDEVLGNDPDGRRRFTDANLALAIVYLNTGATDLALPILRRIADNREQMLGADAPGTAEARGLLAAALAQSGDKAPALAAFEASVPVLLAHTQRMDQETETAARDRIFRQILEAYMATLADTRGTAGAEAAFRLVDAAHGQSAQRALAASSARAAISDPGLADLVRRDQDSQMRLAAAQGTLVNILSRPTAEQDSAAVERLRNEIQQLGRARIALRQEIAQRFPDYAKLIDPAPPDFATLRQSLRPDEALIATHVSKDRVLVWAVSKDRSAFATTPVGRDALSVMVAGLRRSLNPTTVATLGDIPPFDVALAHQLYATVLQPVEAGWKGAKTLIVVPDSVLTEIPFALLVTAPATVKERPGEALFAGYRTVPFLVRDVALVQLPSVAALGSLRALPPGNPGRRQFVGFGDPWFNRAEAAEAQQQKTIAVASLDMRGVHLRAAPATAGLASATLAALPRLPDTAAEVRDVAVALKADPQQDLFLGAAANENRVRSMKLDDRRVIMFATHGLVPGDLDGLSQPALALSAPDVAGVPGNGLLTLDKILALKLDADWVVLSACNTAAGEGKGADAVSGLGRAFFYAGARALLVTNWPVETTSARLLTTATFRHQAADPTLSRAASLRQAELDLIDGPGVVDAEGRIVFSYAHPIFWAPYSLVGDGG
jgi:CHAT domain-containing protein